MNATISADQDLVLAVIDAGQRIEHRLDGSVSHITGISFAEYRLLRTLADEPTGRMSRVDLAAAIQLTPSGVTRALRPLEKLGFVETVKDERDARFALASLTSQGEELVRDASGVIDDAANELVERAPAAGRERIVLTELLGELADGAAR